MGSLRIVTCLALAVLTLTLLAEVHGALIVKRFWVKDVKTSYLTALPRVLPEEVDAKVEFWLINDESTTWPVGTVVDLDTTSAQGWTATSFVNNASVASLPVGSGEVAYFVGKLTAPQSPSTIGTYTLTFKVVVNAATVETFDVQLDTSCDDGLFCNGPEVWVQGTCVSAGVDPCYTIDPSGCTTIICDEDSARCSYELDPGCEVCTGCIPNCTLAEGGQKQCGTDGCGGNCGTCADDLSCVDGACSSVAAPGTCANPLSFFAEGVAIEGRHHLNDDTSNGVYQVTPDCNQGTTAKGLIYKMVIPDGPSYGMMAQLSGFDSVLDVRKDTCRGTSVACNDDATPPGDYGSRVQIMLDPGVYYVLITGYNEENVGPFTFFADFYANCQPRCNSLFCGDNGCGGDCGPCADGETCTESNKCFPASCATNCTGKECGDDGCGGECGDGCPSGELCVRGTGQCEVFEECNFALPTCSPACGADEFCGTDCVCHNVTEGLPDLVISTELLASQVHYQTQQFAAGDCAVVEGCILAPGDRKLIRFTVETANQGQATLALGDPSLRPDIFVWSPCHGHFHFAGYASYKLLSAEEPYEEIASGHKQGYCVYDAYRRLSAPGFSCSTELSCGDQGVQPGWVDNYGWSLDCQWLDITNVPAGNYLLFVEINGPRKIVESSYDNNKAYVPVTITDSPASSLFSHSIWSFLSLFW